MINKIFYFINLFNGFFSMEKTNQPVNEMTWVIHLISEMTISPIEVNENSLLENKVINENEFIKQFSSYINSQKNLIKYDFLISEIKTLEEFKIELKKLLNDTPDIIKKKSLIVKSEINIKKKQKEIIENKNPNIKEIKEELNNEINEYLLNIEEVLKIYKAMRINLKRLENLKEKNEDFSYNIKHIIGKIIYLDKESIKEEINKLKKEEFKIKAYLIEKTQEKKIKDNIEKGEKKINKLKVELEKELEKVKRTQLEKKNFSLKKIENSLDKNKENIKRESTRIKNKKKFQEETIQESLNLNDKISHKYKRIIRKDSKINRNIEKENHENINKKIKEKIKEEVEEKIKKENKEIIQFRKEIEKKLENIENILTNQNLNEKK